MSLEEFEKINEKEVLERLITLEDIFQENAKIKLEVKKLEQFLNRSKTKMDRSGWAL